MMLLRQRYRKEERKDRIHSSRAQVCERKRWQNKYLTHKVLVARDLANLAAYLHVHYGSPSHYSVCRTTLISRTLIS